MKWTEQQRRLIQDIKDKNLLVSAAAGSGKTMVLVERILHFIITERLDIHRLLIVTFTKKAAFEMRHRIQGALEERLPSAGGQESFLRRQLQLLNRSYIKTLHAFCLDLIQDHFHLLSLDPAFRIGEPSEMDLLAVEALEEYLSIGYQKGEADFSLLVDSFGSQWGDQRLQEMILETYRFMHSHPRPFAWLKKAVQLYCVDQGQLHQHPWVFTIKDRLLSHLKAGSGYLQRAMELCERAGGPWEYLETLQQDLQSQESLSSRLQEDLDLFLTKLQEGGFPRLKALRGARREEVHDDLIQEVKTLRDLYKRERRAMISTLGQGGMEKAWGILNHLHSVMETLSQVITGFHHFYQEKKNSHGVLDYSDLEHLALKILEEEEVAAALKEQFLYIFVDEYQDSNPVQEEILNRIRREKNLFMVGDVRQSIYRFRLADPTIFLSKYHTFTPYQDDPGADNLRVDLQKNFRSRGEMIEGVNHLFQKITSLTLGEMIYSEEAFLRKGLSWDWGGVVRPRLILIEEGEDQRKKSPLEVEAEVIAWEIKELLTQKIHLPGEKAPRKIQYRDVVILLRSPSGRDSVFEEVFYQEGIPLLVDKGSGFFSSYEVQVILNLLRVLDNRRQDLPLLSVLHSPVGGFFPEELAFVRKAHPKGSYYTALTKYSQKKNPLGEKVASFLQQLNSWAQKARYLKVAHLIWQLLQESGLYRQAGGLPGGERRQSKLRFLVEKARELEKGSVIHLFDFLTFMDRLAQEDPVGSPVQGEDADAVRLMSIHKSKGLEFPIVIMGDLGRSFNVQDTQGSLLLHRDLGVGLTHVDLERRIITPSLAHRAIKEKKRQEILSEELRILYVALTRAMDRFILVGSVKNLAACRKRWLLGTHPSQLLNASSVLDWIGAALASAPGGGPICRAPGALPKGEESDLFWRVTILSRRDLDEKKRGEAGIKKKELLSFREEKIPEEVEEILDWSYPHQEAVQLPTKLSVSDVGAYAPAVHLEETRNLSFSSHAEEPLKRGIIMHTVMRHIPQKRGAVDISRELEKMVEKGFIHPEDLSLIDGDQISSFLQSSLGKRMMGSSRLYRETPFVLRKRADLLIPTTRSGEEILIQGIIDAFFLEDGEAVLVDYKTGDVTEDDLDVLKERYGHQIHLYREAILVSGWSVKESYLYFFSYGAVAVD